MTPCTDNFMGVGLPSARARSGSARRADLLAGQGELESSQGSGSSTRLEGASRFAVASVPRDGGAKRTRADRRGARLALPADEAAAF